MVFEEAPVLLFFPTTSHTPFRSERRNDSFDIEMRLYLSATFGPRQFLILGGRCQCGVLTCLGASLHNAKSMDLPTPQRESRGMNVSGRRSARLPLFVPVTIKGTAASGGIFKENTWTVGVNKHGAKLATFTQLAGGDQILVENPSLRRSARARVIRVCEKRSPEDPYEIAVELFDPQNIWGVKFPPADWQMDAVPAEARPIPLAEKPSEPPLTNLADQSQRARAESEALLAKFQEFEMGWKSLAEKTREEIEAAGERAVLAAVEALGEKVQKELDPASSSFLAEARTHLQREKTAVVETLLEEARTRLARLAAESFSKAAAQFEASQAQAVENAKREIGHAIETATMGYKRETEDYRRKIADLSASSITGLANYIEVISKGFREELREAARESLLSQSEEALEAYRSNLANQVQKYHQSAGQELEAQVKKLTGEGREEIARLIREEADASSRKSLAAFRSRMDQAVEEARDGVYREVGKGAIALKDWVAQALAGVDANFRASSEGFLQQLRELSKTHLEAHRAEAEQFASNLRSRLQSAADALERKPEEKAHDNQGNPAPPAKPPVPPEGPEPSDDVLDQIVGRARGTQEQALNETVESFSGKIPETLDAFETSSNPSPEPFELPGPPRRR